MYTTDASVTAVVSTIVEWPFCVISTGDEVVVISNSEISCEFVICDSDICASIITVGIVDVPVEDISDNVTIHIHTHMV